MKEKQGIKENLKLHTNNVMQLFEICAESILTLVPQFTIFE